MAKLKFDFIVAGEFMGSCICVKCNYNFDRDFISAIQNEQRRILRGPIATINQQKRFQVLVELAHVASPEEEDSSWNVRPIKATLLDCAEDVRI